MSTPWMTMGTETGEGHVALPNVEHWPDPRKLHGLVCRLMEPDRPLSDADRTLALSVARAYFHAYGRMDGKQAATIRKQVRAASRIDCRERL